MKKNLLPLFALAFALSCSTGGRQADEDVTATPPPEPETISESEIGLAPGTAREQPPQAPIAFNRIDPGESELRPRPNEEFPPVIPHTIEDLETITLSENSCLECHDQSVAEDMGAVAAPASHQVDLRRSPEVAGPGIVGSRWVCTSCHVTQTDTEQLVAQTAAD